MARFSVCGGDDGERSNHRKRQRLYSIDEYEEHSEDSFTEGSGEEYEEETQNRGSEMESDNQVVYTSDDSDTDVLVIRKRVIEKSLDNQASSSSKCSPLSVTLSDPDVLDCPICFEPLKIPIFQCDNGHLACSLCCTKVSNRCPSCTLPIGYTRNRAMENVIEASKVSCRNAKYGCTENTSYGNRFTHEKLCAFTPCSCPIHYCNYTSNYKDLSNHVRDNHRYDSVIPFSCNNPFTIFLAFNVNTTMYMEEDDSCLIVVQSFRTSNAALIRVSCIAPLASEVSDFSCSVVSETDNDLLKQSFMLKNIQKVKKEQPEDGFILIPSYMFDDDNFKVQICISRDPFLVQT